MSTIPGGAADVTYLVDSSGNGNLLRTFHSPNVPEDPDFAMRLDTSPEFVANVPSPTVAATGQPNLLAGDFDSLPALDAPAPAGTLPNESGADDIYTLDAFNAAQPINSYVLNAFTIEASFRIDALDRFQIIVGKDDNPDAAPGPLSPFALKVLNNNVLEAYSFDATGTFRNVLSDQSNPGAPELQMVAGRWYNAAITNDGAEMRMYLDDTTDGVGNYVLLATNSDIEGGAMVPSNDIWTIGRGWFNDGPENPGPDGVADFFDGQIDEVRITDGVLDPSEFLFATEQPTIDADFDNDQDVDGNDFLIWQRNNGGAGGNGDGDADGDGQVDGDDLAAWRQRFGMPVAQGATGAVPEPASAAIALVAVAAFARCRRPEIARRTASSQGFTSMPRVLHPRVVADMRTLR
jgi:hypothetical protein